MNYNLSSNPLEYNHDLRMQEDYDKKLSEEFSGEDFDDILEEEFSEEPETISPSREPLRQTIKRRIRF